MYLFRYRIFRSVIVGLFAALLNTVFLSMAGFFGIRVESGGLLKLLLIQFGSKDFPNFILQSAICRTAFHLFTGILLSLIYGFLLHPLIRRPAPLKGLLYGFSLWLVNGLLVLPQLHQGLFGHDASSSFGIAWFLKANLLFGWLLALGHSRISANPFCFNRFEG